MRQLVERRYSWQAVGPQWLELYAGLTGERRRHDESAGRKHRNAVGLFMVNVGNIRA